MKVLVVDDDREIRELVRQILEACGAEVITAESGEQALAILGGDAGVSLVITDFNIKSSKFDGLELTAAIKARWPEVRVVMISGRAFQITPEQIATAGLEQVIQKPFKPALLVGLIRVRA
jgi:CheY-like chemotaxis protein